MSGVYFVTISWLPAKCHRVKLLLLHFCIVETNNLTLKFLYPNLVCAVKRKRMLMMGLGGVAAAAGKRQRGVARRVPERYPIGIVSGTSK